MTGRAQMYATFWDIIYNQSCDSTSVVTAGNQLVVAATSQLTWQFGLRTLLLMVTLIACGLGLGISFVVLIVALSAAHRLFAQGERTLPFLIVAMLVVLPMVMGIGAFVEIRLDTGDQRRTIWGVPVLIYRMPPESRAALLSLRRPGDRTRWSWCATSVGSNHPPAMVRRFYRRAAVWARNNPDVARCIVDDIGNYVRSTHGLQGLPDCCYLLGPDVLVGEKESERLTEKWREIPEVQEYARRKRLSTVGAAEN